MQASRDVVVCGSCVVDVLVRPVPLDRPIGGGQLVRTEPLELAPGGIVSNAGVTLARLGMRVAAFTYVGRDAWGELLRSRYEGEGIDTRGLLPHDQAPTSTTAVLVDPAGERSFLHAVGAPKLLDKQAFFANRELFAASRAMLLGYFPLLPKLGPDLPEVLQFIQDAGCLTAMDAAGDGGTLEGLAPSLPWLDLYVPSLNEAAHQTGLTDPEQILSAYREAGATGTIGVKLGCEGALLSSKPGEFVSVAAVKPPGPVVDTTGAGDCFLGGLLCGVLRGLPLPDAGRLAAACGARCVTEMGATTALGDYGSTARLAGLPL
ncbi:putative sugar kinase YdjH [Posidoniimonas polymericola]|uniref:Putative sugar kinase YdjH n=1 Tax=Posidoniimonas polymericola TaxID=2528002 RepID=A0A5C5YM14_9BACT|nr:carbohydrate kinase family protein [Posidoniimonas polymericola]TWT76013.1 putative sugar kinase YdjH [Posidoniimonas polymericola]